MPPQGRLGDKSKAMADKHGGLCCPHTVIGPAIQGSPNVFVNFRPALRVGDRGIHAPCCGPNMWKAQKGSATVFINKKAAHRKGDTDKHCGGSGKLIEGSPDVIVGDDGGSAGSVAASAAEIEENLILVEKVSPAQIGPLAPVDEEEEEEGEEEGEEEEKTWIGITLKDREGNPVPKQNFQVTLEGGQILSGMTDDKGYARFDDVDPDQGEVDFTEIPEEEDLEMTEESSEEEDKASTVISTRKGKVSEYPEGFEDMGQAQYIESLEEEEEEEEDGPT